MGRTPALLKGLCSDESNEWNSAIEGVNLTQGATDEGDM
jgi:hypothetical protein